MSPKASYSAINFASTSTLADNHVHNESSYSVLPYVDLEAVAQVAAKKELVLYSTTGPNQLRYYICPIPVNY